MSLSYYLCALFESIIMLDTTKQYINNPEVVLICMTKDHTNHVSGDASEIRTLPLPSEAIKIIEDQLKGTASHNIDSKVKLDASYTSKQLGKYKYELKANLKNILIESDEDEFLRKIQERIVEKMGRPYVANDYQRYLTNNYIESWHNQLKTIYFDRTRIRQLNCLVFILINDMEFFYDKEVERIHIQNEQIGPIENELAQHYFSANTIQDDMLSFMIINPLNEIGNSIEDSNGKWTVKSFTAQRENNYLQLQRLLASEHEVTVVNKKVENETNTVVVSGRNNSVWLQRIMAQNITLHHQTEDLEQLMDVLGIDEAKLQVISGLLGEIPKETTKVKAVTASTHPYNLKPLVT
ncbi:hypothetical protein PHYBLDRAFT_153529 [Phycomyces blakesleeanus NRRL 1555(-)]|uniref:Uncharacterized protein n=1 Tax=Phycomyces blakesleeanus (strain ATCC 8743b / DSM 1359 / FGSC 10004 / NBRC 33097 / NRRL 1555) TaxID=763407 RepID=A0A167J6I6_PHYB8|nr:hypothetical protein PHYBLDRAFT_153529 [Phycomyces blakesleeanus NRRL 1555(-)]OAD65287.1 hypothetical protein PHYBLDRAFT_153529 [Phycomyces blakesleeanus NRRL 1555(-)]|eukprot:XP_018283327.1 hypothetical protein PHYBLDRAFT_153529 [Phycomyces blakesleeanus NRRL 1555(-)]